MQETIHFTLSDNTVLSIQSGEYATLRECTKDILPALKAIKDWNEPMTVGHIKYLKEIGENVASVK